MKFLDWMDEHMRRPVLLAAILQPKNKGCPLAVKTYIAESDLESFDWLYRVLKAIADVEGHKNREKATGALRGIATLLAHGDQCHDRLHDAAVRLECLEDHDEEEVKTAREPTDLENENKILRTQIASLRWMLDAKSHGITLDSDSI